jgi:hypothetical protein
MVLPRTLFPSMQRTILGILAIGLLLTAAVLWLVLPEVGSSVTFAFCWRMAAMIGAAWLAYKDVQRLPGWLLAVVPLLLLVLVRWPRYFLLVLPLVVAIAFFYSRFVRR